MKSKIVFEEHEIVVSAQMDLDSFERTKEWRGYAYPRMNELVFQPILELAELIKNIQISKWMSEKYYSFTSKFIQSFDVWKEIIDEFIVPIWFCEVVRNSLISQSCDITKLMQALEEVLEHLWHLALIRQRHKIYGCSISAIPVFPGIISGAVNSNAKCLVFNQRIFYWLWEVYVLFDKLCETHVALFP